MTPPPASLTELTLPALRGRLRDLGLAESNAPAVLRAFYGGGDFAGLAPRLGGRLVGWLQSIPSTRSLVIARHVSVDGAVKLLLRLDRGETVESVLMPSSRPDRAAGCVSSQVGCAVGCDFCASTLRGLQRNLDAAEILDQYVHLRRLAEAQGRRLRTIVFMGMGEPMHNLPAVLEAARVIGDPALGGIGWRQITISTAGVVPGIDRLAEADLNVHLAVSLHAADDALRSRLAPLNQRWNIASVLAAARRFQDRSGRVVTLEWCLLAGVNDSPAQARLLAERLAGWRVHVNVIAYNAIGAGLSGAVYLRPSPAGVQAFVETLRSLGVVAHARLTRGDDVSAACGQLAGADGAPRAVRA